MQKRIFDQFYQNKHAQLHLSMLLTAHSLHAVWFDLSLQKFVGFEKVLFNSSSSFKAAIQNFGASNKYCKSKSILIANQLFTLIPNDFYSDKDKGTFLKFNQNSVKEDFKIEVSEVEGLETKCVFALHHDIYDVLKHAFDQLKIQAIAKPFIENTSILSNHEMDAFVEINDGRFDIAVFKNKKLQLYNAFEFKTSEDFMYYLLFVMEQLNFDRELHHLHISGELSQEGELFGLIYKYIRNVSWLSRPSQFAESDVLKTIPKHYHFSLFNQILCE